MIKDWARFWGFEPGDVLELQSLGVKVRDYTLNFFAHATDVETAIRLAMLADSDTDNRAQGIYLLANAPNPVVATRDAPGAWHRMKSGESTTDLNMLTRRVLYIDVDAERPSGTSATDAELANTQSVAKRLYADLAAVVGESPLGIGHSGNGAAVLIALDRIPVGTPDLEASIKMILSMCGELYDLPGVKIDRKVFDAKRLLPCWGTVKRKGVPGLADRPHRRTGFACAADIRRVGMSELVQLRSTLAARCGTPFAAPIPKQNKTPGDSPFDRANDVSPLEVATWLGIVTATGVACPGCGETSGVSILDRGLYCHHNRCSEKGRSGFRSNVDLTAEVRDVSPLAAVQLLSEQFGLGVFISDHTDSGFAEMIAASRAFDLRYVTSWGRWIAWDGVRWNVDSGREVAERAPKQIAEFLFALAGHAEDDKQAKKLSGAATRLRTRAVRESALSLARWEISLATHHDRLDRDAEHLLVTPNGTVDLRSGELAPNDPGRLLTHTTSTPYVPGAACPTWERFLADVTAGDAELVGYLQRATGYSLSGSIREHVLFFLYGGGTNGKSTYVEILRHVLGDYTTSLRSEALMSIDRHQHPTAWAGLVGARIVVASEIERGARLAESLVKSITGGDVIAARRMREDFWTFAPQFKLWLLGNDKPVIRGTDEGIWRRFRLVPFAVSFLGREDRELREKLHTEAPGILRWAVDGARAWYAAGLCEPASVRAATEIYRAEQDIFGLWVRDELEFSAGKSTLSAELRHNYENWCVSNGAHPIGVRDYCERLTRLGAVARRGNRGRFWEGVSVLARAPGALRVIA